MNIIKRDDLIKRYKLARANGVPREQAIAVLAAVHDLPELTVCDVVAEFERVAA